MQLLDLILLVLFCAIGRVTALRSGVRCSPKLLSESDSIVCLCNATYCDTIELPRSLEKDKVYAYTSSQSGLRFELSKSLTQQFSDIGNTSLPNVDAFITIFPNKIKQEVLGFGGALTDSTGMNIAGLSRQTQKKLLDSYFSKNGIEYSFVRVPIAGSDFSLRKYTYADNNCSVSLETGMRLQPEDFYFKIPFLKEIMRRNPYYIKLIASAWYAPEWMLTTDYQNRRVVDPIHYDAWAEYHKKFFDYYKLFNISFWGMTTGNEIGLGIVSLPWDIKEHQRWINDHLGPLMESSEYDDIKMFLLDDSTSYMWLCQGLLHNMKTYKYISGIATHWYMDRKISMFHYAFHNKFPEKMILSTEACMCKNTSDYLYLSEWDKAEAYATNILENLMAYCNGWIDWNLALDPEGGPNHIRNFCDSPIMVNSTTDEFYKRPMFYAMGHFSKFVPPGSRNIGLSVRPFRRYLEAAAFAVKDVPWNYTLVLQNR